MSDTINRREFVVTSAAAGLAAATPGLAGVARAMPAPAVLTRAAVRPVVISAANGNHSKDAAGKTGVQEAYEMIVGGADVLDAVIACVNVVELDPDDSSVGYGGLPNADGVVQLDSCCMHGPLKRAGGVAALEGVPTPSPVAKAVAGHTGNQLLAGAAAPAAAPASHSRAVSGAVPHADSSSNRAAIERPFNTGGKLETPQCGGKHGVRTSGRG